MLFLDDIRPLLKTEVSFIIPLALGKFEVMFISGLKFKKRKKEQVE